MLLMRVQYVTEERRGQCVTKEKRGKSITEERRVLLRRRTVCY